MEFETAVDIEAPEQRVWEVLTDVESWPKRTASVTSINLLDGTPLREGSQAKVKQPRLPVATWRVTDLVPMQRFTWESSRGGVTTAADHVIAARSGGGVRVTLGVRTRGPLASVAGPLMAPVSRRYVTMEAAGLKARCEAAAGT